MLEKNAQPGRKLLITGSGRCNVTSHLALPDFIDQYFGQGRFLYPAFHRFFRPELLGLLADHGTPCHLDHQGKYFPESDRAEDVLAALLRYAKGNGVRLETGCPVHAIRQTESGFIVVTAAGERAASAVIVTTGGMTYPVTGSTGDGYAWAKSLGHTIQPVRPALVPLVCAQPQLRALSGLSLPDVQCTLKQPGQKHARLRGDLLITHKGVSGPVVLRLSRYWVNKESGANGPGTQLVINLAPDLEQSDLQATLAESLLAQGLHQLKNSLDRFMPRRLAPLVIAAAGLSAELPAEKTGLAACERLAQAIQHWSLPIVGQQGLHLAMITAGGVSLREVDPATLGSKKTPGLYFAGEILDIDGDTGGFNLQAAFSTGFLAGVSAAGYWLHQQPGS